MKCTAHSKQSGAPCKQPAIAGGRVCRYHGGAAPQVKRSAQERLALLVDPAIDQLTKLLKVVGEPAVRLRAARDILDRAGLKPKDEIKADVALEVVIRSVLDETKEP